MNKVKIITDSCCSLPPQKLQELDIDYIAMDITVDGTTYNSFDCPITDPEEFYSLLEQSESCSTSCINNFAFNEKFEKYVKEGYDVFYVGLSGGMSCTCSNAKAVADELNAKYGKHVWVADSLIGSFSIGFDVLAAKKMADDGMTAQEIFKVIDQNGLKTFAVFAPGDLKFLKKSGRISKFVASIGSVLKIVPIITSNDKGELKLLNKAIGRKRAMKLLEEYVLKHADLTSPGKMYVGHTGQKEEAEQFANFLRENTKNKEIIVDYIDYTMGCNCGPRTISVFGFLK